MGKPKRPGGGCEVPGCRHKWDGSTRFNLKLCRICRRDLKAMLRRADEAKRPLPRTPHMRPVYRVDFDPKRRGD